MVEKRFITSLSISILAFAALIIVLTKNIEKQIPNANENTKNSVTENQQTLQKPIVTKPKFDLYSASTYDLPLISIVDIAKLSSTVKKKIDTILEASQGFYLLKYNNEDKKVLILLQNPITESNTFHRHDLQYVVIDENGNHTIHNAGYCGLEGETDNIVKQDNDEWLFDESTEPYRPIKHIAFDEDGKISFTEYWNYSDNEAIKYEMKDARKKTISIIKETKDNDSNFRREHIFYDNNGSIKMSLTINYDGANLSRFTYYNSHDSIDSLSIMSEFTDGIRSKESVYNEDYQLVCTAIAEIKNGERKSITILDAEGDELERISN